MKIILSDLNKPRKGSIIYKENESKRQTSLLGNILFLILFKLFYLFSILDTFAMCRWIDIKTQSTTLVVIPPGLQGL